VANSLVSAQGALDAAEVDALDPLLRPDERLELQRIASEIAPARTRMAALPTNAEELTTRRKKMQARMVALDREAFRLGTELQSMNAILVATHKWVVDTRNQRKDSPDDERAFVEKMKSEQRSLNALDDEEARLRGDLAAQRALVDTTVSGEAALRAELTNSSSRTQGILSGAEPRASGEAGQFVARARDLRSQIATMQQRTTAAQTSLAAQVSRKALEIRQKLAVEQKLLDGYGRDVGTVSGDARQLVGRMAYDSFRRVRKQFYDLVLKADVGVVDTAFTKKQATTIGIQKVASQKEEELRALDEEFRPVLKEVD